MKGESCDESFSFSLAGQNRGLQLATGSGGPAVLQIRGSSGPPCFEFHFPNITPPLLFILLDTP